MANAEAVLVFFALLLGSPAVHATDNLHRTGLIMHLDASTGANAANGVVTHWWDQSGFGQNLTAKGLPRVIHDALNGKPVIQLASDRDGFSQSGPSSLPIYENDRTLLVLSAPAQTSVSIGWGAAQNCKQSFAVHHDKQSYSAVSTGCTEDLMHAQSALAAGQWRLNVLLVKNGVLYHLRNGNLVDARTARLTTRSGPFTVSTGSMDDGGYLRIATVLGYNWALGAAELRSLHAYLGKRWFANADHFEVPPDLSTVIIPPPQIQLSKRTIASGGMEVNWRASFAQACSPNGNWTNSSATSGTQKIETPIPGSTYAMDCWTPTDSNASSLGEGAINGRDGRANTRISWRPAAARGHTVVAYRLYISSSPGKFDRAIRIPSNPQNEYSLDLKPGRYYLSMASITAAGEESRVSKETEILIN